MMITLLFLYAFLQFAAGFPENLSPITILQNVPQRLFFVDDPSNPLYVQILKKLTLKGTKNIAVAGREKLFFLTPDELSPFGKNDLTNLTEVLTWKATKETRDLCYMKGQPQEFCYNYMSVLETKTEDDLIICGTNSYSPQCANYKASSNKNKLTLTEEGDKINGRLISPYGPSQSGASFFTGDSLYSATYQSFLGGSPVVSRTMGNTPSLRTDESTTLMKDPEFVKITADDQRVLIFFNEKESLPTGETRTIAQVAQVCKNDQGGEHILQGMFTTFLKSRLNCSYNGFYLDQVRDVTDPVKIEDQSVIFATFATPDNSLSGSAICSFNISSVNAAMNGPFLTNDDFSSSAAPPTASRHPGLCPEAKATASESVFVKSHPQMEKHVIGSLLLTNQGKRWTAIAVDVISSLQDFPVVFIGTEDGHLVRALPPSEGHPRGKIISDQNVFDASRCSAFETTEKLFDWRQKRVERILIEGDMILVGFKHCVVSLPLRWCSPHLCRSACLRASDPYCAWNGTECVSSNTPHSFLEQDLASSSSALTSPCQITSNEEIAPEKSEQNPEPTHPNVPGEDNQHEEESRLPQGELYSLQNVILVAGIASGITVLVFLIIFCFCYRCCCRKQMKKDPEDFNEKQMLQQHSFALQSDEKFNSLSRTAHKTFCGMKNWFWKSTPVNSPELPSKHDFVKHRERRQNEYSPAPTVNQKTMEKPRTSRIMSSRLNSTSSVTSREDSMGYNFANQPLLPPRTQSSIDNELTLPKNFSEQSTLPFKPSGDSTISSGVSSQSSSSPVFPENGNGAAETGVFPTASTKMRRRNESVARKTSEIMQEPDAAMGSFGDAFHNIKLMQVQGDVMSSDSERMQSPARFRLDSHDSGRGDSCRNSIRTEFEQNFPHGNGRSQRPASLDIHGKPPNRRRRLHSEGSHPYELQVGVVANSKDQPHRERRISGNSSQASTPIAEHPIGVFFHPSQQPVINTSTYSTLPKEDGFYKPQQRDVLRLKSLQHDMAPRQPIEYYNSKSEISGHPPPYHNEQPIFIQSFAKPTNAPINYYPSLQVRGVHAQPLTVHPQQKPHQNRRSYSPPQNYYPSLPSNFKGPKVSNRYSHPPNYSSLERQTTPTKKRQSVPLTRHISMPASQRPMVYVSPFKASSNCG